MGNDLSLVERTKLSSYLILENTIRKLKITEAIQILKPLLGMHLILTFLFQEKKKE